MEQAQRTVKETVDSVTQIIDRALKSRGARVTILVDMARNQFGERAAMSLVTQAATKAREVSAQAPDTESQVFCDQLTSLIRIEANMRAWPLSDRVASVDSQGYAAGEIQTSDHVTIVDERKGKGENSRG